MLDPEDCNVDRRLAKECRVTFILCTTDGCEKLRMRVSFALTLLENQLKKKEKRKKKIKQDVQVTR